MEDKKDNNDFILCDVCGAIMPWTGSDKKDGVKRVCDLCFEGLRSIQLGIEEGKKQERKIIENRGYGLIPRFMCFLLGHKLRYENIHGFLAWHTRCPRCGAQLCGPDKEK